MGLEHASCAGSRTATPHGPDGLLMLLGWGPGYFARHAETAAPIGRPVALARGEHAALEDIDACLHLASDDEERLDDRCRRCWSGMASSTRGSAAGARGPHRARRAPGCPPRVAGAQVPADSPLLLGFHSGLRRNQATEAEITIPDGPLAGGTTMHVSRIDLDLDGLVRAGAGRAAPR